MPVRSIFQSGLRHCYFSIVIVALIADLLVTPAARAQNNDPRITNPVQNATVCMRLLAQGTSRIRSDLRLGLLIQPRGFGDQFWPQNWPTVRPTGEWDSLVYFGQPNDAGLAFSLTAAYFDDAGQAMIEAYFTYGKRTGDWRPIPFPQPALPNLDEVTVVRGSC